LVKACPSRWKILEMILPMGENKAHSEGGLYLEEASVEECPR
jgi:hypothetical protein